MFTAASNRDQFRNAALTSTSAIKASRGSSSLSEPPPPPPPPPDWNCFLVGEFSAGIYGRSALLDSSSSSSK